MENKLKTKVSLFDAYLIVKVNAFVNGKEYKFDEDYRIKVDPNTNIAYIKHLVVHLHRNDYSIVV